MKQTQPNETFLWHAFVAQLITCWIWCSYVHICLSVFDSNNFFYSFSFFFIRLGSVPEKNRLHLIVIWYSTSSSKWKKTRKFWTNEKHLTEQEKQDSIQRERKKCGTFDPFLGVFFRSFRYFIFFSKTFHIIYESWIIDRIVSKFLVLLSVLHLTGWKSNT